MRYAAVIELVRVAHQPDEFGRQVPERTYRLVHANEFSVSATEFWEAGRAGLRPEREYQLRACDYADEAAVRVDGIEYDVIRTERRGEWVRLVCARKVRNG